MFIVIIMNTFLYLPGLLSLMDIMAGIEIDGLALILKKYHALVLGDTHIGMEEALNKQGMLVPRFQTKEIYSHLEELFLKTKKFDKIILNGDIKHEFGTISEQEWRDTIKTLDYLGEHCQELILVKGNHDKKLGPIARKRSIKIVDHIVFGDIYITHGDKIPNNAEFAKAKIICIGHEHPAVSLAEGSRMETFKCFLKGAWRKKTLLVLPSFNFVSEGTDMLKEKSLSPFLAGNIGQFEVFVAGVTVYPFGKIKNLRKH
jgi:putative SbcD/Mre11-related phosphoesterase